MSAITSSSISICKLTEANRKEVSAHFQKLSLHDRRNRFLYTIDTQALIEFVQRIDLFSVTLLGAYLTCPSHDKTILIGVCLLNNDEKDQSVEFSLSVDAEHRKLGCGTALLTEAIKVAKQMASKQLKIECFASNDHMIKLAKKFSIKLEANPVSGFQLLGYLTI